MAAHKKNGAKQTKTQFVLAHPGLSARDMIAQAKDAGLELTDKYIYSIRSAARGRTNGLGAKAAAAAKGGDAAGLESLLLAVAAEVGLRAAVELLQARRADVLRAVSGRGS